MKRWADGSSSNYGSMNGIDNCKAECDKHIDCFGFVVPDISDSKENCGYWKNGFIDPKEASNQGCYAKISSKNDAVLLLL